MVEGEGQGLFGNVPFYGLFVLWYVECSGYCTDVDIQVWGYRDAPWVTAERQKYGG